MAFGVAYIFSNCKSVLVRCAAIGTHLYRVARARFWASNNHRANMGPFEVIRVSRVCAPRSLSPVRNTEHTHTIYNRSFSKRTRDFGGPPNRPHFPPLTPPLPFT